MYVLSKQTVEMLRQNKIAPFQFVRSRDKFVFSFTYRRVAECLGQVQQLHRAASLPPVEQAGMVAAINYSRQSRGAFDTCWLDNIAETIVFETVANRVAPLVLNQGRILLTNQFLYFQSDNNVEKDPVIKIRLKNITSVFCRRYLLRPQGLEISYEDEKGAKQQIYWSIVKKGDRDLLYKKMMEVEEGVRSQSDEMEMKTLQWQHGVISNYDYLLHLNSLADRSFNDLTQYPVFPWVLAQYSKQTLDLNDDNSFRDLSKPVGALNAERLENLKLRREEMRSSSSSSVGSYLYGSHYSCPGFVLYYLVRKNPQLMLCLQNGKFDHPDRMFNSLQQTWKNVTTNTSDFKELVPEFYDPDNGGDFLCNKMEIEFGTRHTGQQVGDVELPAWASDPRDLVHKLRMALESPAVSRSLHLWINLIFGYKNCGEEAELADNVFYPLCYEGGVDLDSIADLEERFALEVQISEFGQVPKQIFSRPHPHRYTALPAEIHGKVRTGGGDTKEERGARWGRGTALARLGDHQSHKEGVSAVCVLASGLAVSASHDSSVKCYRWGEAGGGTVERTVSARSLTISSLVSPGPCTIILGCWDNTIMVHSLVTGAWRSHLEAHRDAVSCLAFAGTDSLVSGSWDGTVKLWRCSAANNYSLGLADLQCEMDHGAAVTCVDLQRDVVAGGTREGEVLVWTVQAQVASLTHRLPCHSKKVNSVKLAGDKILSGGSDMAVKVFHLTTGSVVFSRNVGEEVLCLAWDGEVAAMGGGRGHVILWNLTQAPGAGEPGTRVRAHTGPVTSLAVMEAAEAGAGVVIVTGGEDRRVIVWRQE